MATAQFSNTTYGNAFVDALSSGYRFVPSGSDGAKPLITYYLNGAGWASNGAAQAFTAAVTAWSTVANISFQRVYSQTGATWTESLYSDGSDTLGAHYYPNDEGSGGEFNQGHEFFTYNMLGGVGFVTFLHEIGHGLGLDHPFEDGANFPGVTAGDSTDQGDNNFANGFYTVMSYTDDPWFAVAPWYDYGYCATPMAFDIATIQRVYGANMSTATGNNIYTLPTNNAAGTYWSCIWDAGGTDTISGAASSGGVTIDLRAATLENAEGGGGWASWQSGTLGGSVVYGGFTIANGAVIENATGSNYNDVLTGNNVGNSINGGLGNDTIRSYSGNDTVSGGAGDDQIDGGLGNDYIDAGAGTDMAIYSGSSAGVTVNLALTGAQATGAWGTDTLLNFENLAGSGHADRLYGNGVANAIYGAGGNDFIWGQGGNDNLVGQDGRDYLFGGAGDDFVRGGADHDSVNGDAGNDTLWGEAGSDRLTGGQGADKLVGGDGLDAFIWLYLTDLTAARATTDQVLDFNRGQGDKLDLQALDAKSGTAANDAFTFIGAGAFTNVAGQLRAVVVGSTTWVEGDVNGDGVVDFSIALTGSHSLAASDFIL